MSYKQERQFGLIFAAFFAIVAFWPLWPLHAPSMAWLTASIASGAVALICPRLLAVPNRLWLKFGHALGWVNARIILGFVFFVMVTPIGLVMRLFGKDPLRMRSPKSSSYWIRREQPLDPKSLRNQF